MRPARHFKELIVWQLGDELRSEVFTLTKQRPLRDDLKLRSQLDDAADSVCRNIAEGFGCDRRLYPALSSLIRHLDRRRPRNSNAK